MRFLTEFADFGVGAFLSADLRGVFGDLGVDMLAIGFPENMRWIKNKRRSSNRNKSMKERF